jgi:multidrug efflux pump subunit AcrB
VRDGFTPQTNIVRQNGRRGTLITILKGGDASTIDVVKGIRDLLPRIAPTLPLELKIQPLADQSVFVRAAVNGVIKEAVIAACLTGLMILLFLGNWRSTIIIAVSIPLSILTSVLSLGFLHETINLMTLGGLALAVGILVDDATVTIENIERHLSEGKKQHDGILDGAAQIAVPAFVSTLAICIVFLPMFFLTGVARYLFVPLAESVVFAMLASYILSRTLVPTLAMYLLKTNDHRHVGSQNLFGRFQQRSRAFEQSRSAYRSFSDGVRPPTTDLYPFFSLSVSRLLYWSSGLASTSSPPRTASNLFCISGRGAARASRRPQSCATSSKTRSGVKSRPASWTTSSTISGCRTARSTRCTTLPAYSAPPTRTFSSR